MEMEKLDAEGIKREEKHIGDINLQILTLKKECAEYVVDKNAYKQELESKIQAHMAKITALEFDIKHDYSYKLAMSKIDANLTKVKVLQSNIKVHERHINEGVPISKK